MVAGVVIIAVILSNVSTRLKAYHHPACSTADRCVIYMRRTDVGHRRFNQASTPLFCQLNSEFSHSLTCLMTIDNRSITTGTTCRKCSMRCNYRCLTDLFCELSCLITIHRAHRLCSSFAKTRVSRPPEY